MISFSIDKQRGKVNAEWMSRPVDSLKNKTKNQPLALVLISMAQSPIFAYRLKRKLSTGPIFGEAYKTERIYLGARHERYLETMTDKTISRQFGKLIKYTRRKKLMTKSELADLLGTNRNHILFIERGANPSFLLVFKISSALGLKTSELIKSLEIAIKKVNLTQVVN